MESPTSSSDLSSEVVLVQVRSFDGIISVPIRQPSLQDVSNILAIARRTGWYGNLDLLQAIAQSSVIAPSAILEKMTKDIFLNANVSKEVWILALRRLARYTAKLSKGLPGTQVPKIHRYKSRDLATPGLLYFIRQDLNNIDTEKFARFVLNSHLREAKFDSKSLTKRQALNLLRKKVGYYKAAAWIMEILGVEPRLFKAPQLRLLNEGDRLYATFVLATTLDWRQYYQLMRAYNRTLAILLGQSLQLAGMSAESASSRLQAGTPLFGSLVSPPEKLPFRVCVALANDAHLDRIDHVSRQYRPVVRESISASKKAARAGLRGREASRARVQELWLALLNDFSKRISSTPGLVLDACITYHDEFCRHLKRELEEEVDKYQEAVKLTHIPDCYILVEGASDVEYVEAAIELLGGVDLRLRVEECNGKAGVLRRFRDIIQKHSYIGSVAALLDSDAESEFRDLEKLLRESKKLLATKLTSGTIEDCFRLRYRFGHLTPFTPEGHASK